MKLTAFTFFLFLISLKTFAGFIGDISFTEEMKKVHLESITSLTDEVSDCLKRDLNRHQEFYKKYGISAFYGENSPFSRLSEKEKINFLISKNLDPKLINEIEVTSCIGLTLKCLERGFIVTNQAQAYKSLKAFVVLNGVDGTALQYGLSKLGWKTLYWNPKPSSNKMWDLQEKIVDPENKTHYRGFHEENYIAVKSKKRYFMNNVDDATTLLNFGDNEPSFLKQIPLFVGTAHMGFHVFCGFYGVVVESHADRALTDEKTIESAPFNPLDNQAAPSGGIYRSGILSIPPTFQVK